MPQSQGKKPMKQEISEALLDFYHTILRPEFTGIHDKLAEHDRRFDEMTGHFDAVYRRLDNHDQEFVMVNQGLRRLEGRMDHLEAKVENLDKKIDTVEQNLNVKIDAVEQNLTAHIDAVEQNLTAHIDVVAADLAAHRRDTEAHSIYRIGE